MRKILAFLASSAALLGAPTVAASEAYLVPQAAWIFEGSVSVTGGITLICDATIELSGPNDAADMSPTLGHSDLSGISATVTISGGTFGLCSSATVQPIVAGDVSYASGTFTFDNVLMSFWGRSCSGTLTGAWNEAGFPQTLTVSSALSGGCTISGVLSLTSPGSGNAVGAADWDHHPNHP